MRENKIMIVGALLVIGFFGFAFNQNAANKTKTPGTDYTTIDKNSPMRRGNPDAKVSFIQYSDFLCPSCSYISTQIMPEIDKKYVQTNQVQVEFRPMAFIADGSLQAGMGAYCAVDQNKFWPYHDAIYTYVADKVYNVGLDPKTDVILTSGLVKTLAAKAGLASAEFDSCLDSKKHLADINNSTNTANRNGVTGTPYLIIGGKPLTSNPSLATIESMIKAAQ